MARDRRVGLSGVPKFKQTLAAKRERARIVYDILRETYPDAKCSLNHRTPLQLMVATILSAQCTDDRVNIVTKDLFREFKTPRDYVEKPRKKLETMIQSCGFYRQKAKSIVNACQKIIDEYDGKVPDTLEDLVKLDGVGRKTANVILGTCFDTPGVIVDTHCKRLSRRLGFTKHEDPTKIEFDLMKILPEETWTMYSHLTIYHGRAICQARAPRCSECPVREYCPFPDTREGKKIAR